MIDLGSGQYNGDQHIRNFFRSTIAHNTVEIGGKNQARILGPFMWEKSYTTNLEKSGNSPNLHAQASHSGYKETFSITHTRKVDWLARTHLNICDLFSGSYGIPMKGAFHLGPCISVSQDENIVEADFGAFTFSIIFPTRIFNQSILRIQRSFHGLAFNDLRKMGTDSFNNIFKRNSKEPSI